MSRYWTISIRSLAGLAGVLLAAGLLVGCQQAAPFSRTALPTPVALETAPRPASPTPAPSPSPRPAAWVVVQPDDAPPEARAWTQTTQAPAEAAGLRWLTVPELDAVPPNDPVHALIALPPTPWEDAQEWALAHPEVRVLAWATEPGRGPDPAGLPPNLTVVAEPLTWEQRFFLAGYTTILATTHWRAGLLYTSPPGYAAQTLAAAFDRGAAYWCGPCVPAYPPMVAYPFAEEVPPGVTDPAAWQEAAQRLLAQAPLEAVYLRGPGAEAALPVFQEQGVIVIWDGPPIEHAQVRVYADLWGALDAAWLQAWLQGQTGSVVGAPWKVDAPTDAALSPGRIRLVRELADALQQGLVRAAPDAP